MLDLKEFKILVALEEQRCKSLTQREIAAASGLSVGTVNRVMPLLRERGLVRDGVLTDCGLEALDPYRVKRAVLVAAGFGSRLVPITLNTPKPLIRVHGQRIIDSLLDAVLAAGIEDILIVRGYLAEQFDQLLYKYPMVKFIDNPLYNEANNISSILAARDIPAIQKNHSFVRLQQSDEDAQRRRLSASGRPQDGQELTFTHIESEVVQRLFPIKALDQAPHGKLGRIFANRIGHQYFHFSSNLFFSSGSVMPVISA